MLFGRAVELRNLQDHLVHGSLLVSGPRRIGKTELLKHLIGGHISGIDAIRVDVAGMADEAGGYELLRQAIEEHLGVEPGLGSRVRAAQAGVGPVSAGVEIDGPRDRTPEEGLRRILRRWHEGLPEGTLGVLAIDEVPWWLDEVRAGDPRAARGVLATLRRLRQDDATPGLRQILTGSVSLPGLASELGALAELNDLVPMAIGPLAVDDAERLARSELAGRPLAPEVASRITGEAGAIPHWVKRIASRARAEAGTGTVTAAHVEAAVEELVRDRRLFEDDLIQHFERRHPTRAGAFRAVVRAAADPRGGRFEPLVAAAWARLGPETTRDAAEDVVRTLGEEHTLVERDGTWTFVNPLMRRWVLRWGATW